MARYTKKAQVLLTEEQHRALTSIAEERDRPLGALLREAAEEVHLRRRRQRAKARAVDELLSLPPTEVPEAYEDWEKDYLDQRSTGG